MENVQNYQLVFGSFEEQWDIESRFQFLYVNDAHGEHKIREEGEKRRDLNFKCIRL
jgi:hypothetical protein